jgi:hypothetical protein
MMMKTSKMMKMIIKINIGATRKTKLWNTTILCHCLLHETKNITLNLVSSEQLDGGMKRNLMCNVF